ncbi:dynein light chain Tctex-type protein 2B isoform X2 [Nycticebus coucang]|uniref:dynein light chain Tctex-type protein 2B isoform X2 n=1 Tax=Nycticebus coucang TaxID=9470 RepID=UPI00234C9CE7|nr:dynein light chain Tctex-type protein 2B isoform X2 [Nycticebus coucang]
MATPTGASSTVGASFSHGDGAPETEKNVGEPENTYILRPVFQQRFRPSVVKDCIHAVLKEELANAEYSPEEMPQLTKHLSENIKDKLKGQLILCRSGIWLFLLLNLLKIWEKDTTMKKSELFNIVKYLDKIKISCQFGN